MPIQLTKLSLTWLGWRAENLSKYQALEHDDVPLLFVSSRYICMYYYTYRLSLCSRQVGVYKSFNSGRLVTKVEK
jgi:hypothetical protein